MAAHRYWRATAFEAYGTGDLELSEFHLLSGGARVDATATLTASVAPDVSGVLTNLQDDVLSTAARWSAREVKGLTLQWDFGGSTVDMDDIRLAGDSEWRFPLIVKMQWSADATIWLDAQTYAGVTWPGSRVMSSTSPALSPGAIIALPCEGVAGSTALIDLTGRAWTPYGSMTISTAQYAYGGSSAYSPSGTGGAYTPYDPDLNLGSGDFTLSLWLFTTSAASQEICGHRSGGVVDLWFLRKTDGNQIRFLNKQAGVTQVDLTVGSISLNTGTHVELVRSSSAFTIYIDGFFGGSATSSAPMACPTVPFWFMLGDDSGGDGMRGYVDDFLLQKGVAAHTSEFTPGPMTASRLARNKVQGRCHSVLQQSLGDGPTMVYGIPKIALPDYLSVESGSVKDLITGVLGEGIGRVKGTVATKGSPNQFVHRKVRLIRERDGVVIRELWSDAITGEYDFQWVDEAQTFTVVSYDHLHNYRAVIADNLVPELMP